jgi:adiponectin receptor
LSTGKETILQFYLVIDLHPIRTGLLLQGTTPILKKLLTTCLHLRSLFYWHNESINVYSHLLGAIAFYIAGIVLYRRLRPLYKTVSSEDVVVFACFFGGAIFCLTTSSMYHLVSNHSFAVSRWGNALDYLGIVSLIWGSFIPSLYYGWQDRVHLIQAYWAMV